MAVGLQQSQPLGAPTGAQIDRRAPGAGPIPPCRGGRPGAGWSSPITCWSRVSHHRGFGQPFAKSFHDPRRWVHSRTSGSSSFEGGRVPGGRPWVEYRVEGVQANFLICGGTQRGGGTVVDAKACRTGDAVPGSNEKLAARFVRCPSAYRSDAASCQRSLTPSRRLYNARFHSASRTWPSCWRLTPAINAQGAPAEKPAGLHWGPAPAVLSHGRTEWPW